MTKRTGNSIVEVLIGISIAALVIVSVGNLVSSVNAADQAAANKTQALAYARESLEVMAAVGRTEFLCSGGASGGTCTIGGQSCQSLAGYTSCWLPCPQSVPTCTAATTYHLVHTGAWQLAADSETVGSSPAFERFLTITNGGNGDQKQVTSTVRWTEGSRTPSVELSTMLSAWKQ